MKRQLLVAARVLGVSLILLGLAYPLAVYVVGRVAFPFRAGGSLIREGNRVVGSALTAQEFSLPRYFAPRPSAGGYDARSSGGSSLGPTSAKLFDIYRGRIDSLRAANPAAGGPVPLELVAASGSGLDPDISPAAALWQAPRVAAARNIPVSELTGLIRDISRPPLFGIVGEWRVNVFELNRRVDDLALRRGRK